MVIYLPVALLRDCFCSLLDKNIFKNLFGNRSLTSTSTGLDIPLRINELNNSLETDLRSSLITDKDLSEREEGWPLIAKIDKDEPHVLEQRSELSSWAIAKWSLYLTPIWFITEVT